MATDSPSTSAAGGLAKRYRPAPAKTFQCRGFGDCRMVFSRSEHLARHIRKHTGERPFTCHCSKQFSRLDNLRQHAQTVHADKQDENERMMRELTTLHATMAGGVGGSKGRRGGGSSAGLTTTSGSGRDAGTPPKQVKLEDGLTGDISDGDVDMELLPTSGDRMMIDVTRRLPTSTSSSSAQYEYEYAQRPRPGTTAGYEAGHSVSPDDESSRQSFRRHFRDSSPSGAHHSFRDQSPPQQQHQQSFRGMYDYDYDPTSSYDPYDTYDPYFSDSSHSPSISPSPSYAGVGVGVGHGMTPSPMHSPTFPPPHQTQGNSPASTDSGYHSHTHSPHLPSPYGANGNAGGGHTQTAYHESNAAYYHQQAQLLQQQAQQQQRYRSQVNEGYPPSASTYAPQQQPYSSAHHHHHHQAYPPESFAIY